MGELLQVCSFSEGNTTICSRLLVLVKPVVHKPLKRMGVFT